MEEGLKSKLQAHYGGLDIDQAVLYDVKLKFTDDGGLTWYDATAENFPASGIEVTMPFPEGTSYQNYRFYVAHIFESEANGHAIGEIEYPYAYTDSEGIHFRVYGLSPVLMSWKKVTSATHENDHGNRDTDSRRSSNSRSRSTRSSESGLARFVVTDGTDATDAAVQEYDSFVAPKTGGREPVGYYILMLLCGIGLLGYGIKVK